MLLLFKYELDESFETMWKVNVAKLKQSVVWDITHVSCVREKTCQIKCLVSKISVLSYLCAARILMLKQK